MNFLNIFQEQFSNFVGQNRSITFTDLLHETLLLSPQEIGERDIKQLKDWFNKIYHLNFLQEFMQEKNITEIIVHNHHSVQVEIAGSLQDRAISLEEKDLEIALESMALQNRIDWNFSSPYSSFFVQMQEGVFRATLIHKSITPRKNSKLFLRRINQSIFPLDQFIEDALTVQLLRSLIQEKQNIIISGATSSGKTSLMRSLIDDIDDQEHLVILEDTHEITTDKDNITSLLSDPSSEQKSLAQYCAYALRMRPERIIVGEIRSKEIIPLILAASNGHKGLLSSIHANSAKDAIARMALLFALYGESMHITYSSIVKLICQNINYVVHLEKKRVVQIIKILGAEENNPLFEYIYPLEKVNLSSLSFSY